MRLNPSIDDDVRARGVVLPNLGEDRRVERPVNRGILLRGATERLEAHPALLRHRPELRACRNEDVRPGVGPPLGDGRLAAAGWSSDHEDHPGPQTVSSGSARSGTPIAWRRRLKRTYRKMRVTICPKGIARREYRSSQAGMRTTNKGRNTWVDQGTVIHWFPWSRSTVSTKRRNQTIMTMKKNIVQAVALYGLVIISI